MAEALTVHALLIIPSAESLKAERSAKRNTTLGGVVLAHIVIDEKSGADCKCPLDEHPNWGIYELAVVSSG